MVILPVNSIPPFQNRSSETARFGNRSSGRVRLESLPPLDPSEITRAFHRAESVLSVFLLLEIAIYQRNRERLSHMTAGKAMVRQYAVDFPTYWILCCCARVY